MTGHIHHQSPPEGDNNATGNLIAALNSPEAFGHPVKYIRHIETHISWVILTGDFAYKIKKPVNFGFLDFSTLEKRHYYCAEELRLNQRFGADIYLQLKPIRGSLSAPSMNGEGEIIEYAIKMAEFPQQCLLSSYSTNGTLNAALIDRIADKISALHSAAQAVDRNTTYGSPQVVRQWSEENMQQLEQAIPTRMLPRAFSLLQRWYAESGAQDKLIEQRRQSGFVRDCHGDLHLGNMAMINDQVTLFDCIEFNPELRWIDTLSEAAFVAMDLQARGHHDFCWQFLNRYLENRNDYEALKLLPYYIIYRALVRAKVAALRGSQGKTAGHADSKQIRVALDYIDLAENWAQRTAPALIIMHGVSGSGKSTIAGQIGQALGAIQLRSDVIRKRLHKIDVDEASGSALGQGIYSSAATRDTYRLLRETAARVLEAGFTVIVDATFLEKENRQQMQDLAKTLACPALVVHCEVAEAELRRRILERQQDPSEADLDVLQHQLDHYEPLETDPVASVPVVSIDHNGLGLFQLQQIRDLISGQADRLSPGVVC